MNLFSYQLHRPFVISHSVLFVSIFVLGILGTLVNPWLEYQSTGISSGQVWRLLTGHVVHLGWQHMLLNLLSFFVMLKIFGGVLTTKQWFLFYILEALFISTGLWLFCPELQFYAGFSGVLHGVITLALFLDIKREQLFPKAITVTVLAAVVAKLVWEQTQYYGGGYIEQLMNAPVIVNSHLYGAIGGAVTALLFSTFSRLR